MAKTEYTEVTMDDGRVVEFAGKRRMVKSTTISPDGFEVETRIDFVNGESRVFKIEANAKLFAQFAAHGIEQKLGDEAAGLEDVEDAVIAVEELIARLEGGEWAQKREKSGLAGAGALLRALVEHSGKPVEQVRAYLAAKTHQEKLALRTNSAIAPIIARLEANKKKKEKVEVDTEALLGDLVD